MIFMTFWYVFLLMKSTWSVSWVPPEFFWIASGLSLWIIFRIYNFSIENWPFDVFFTLWVVRGDILFMWLTNFSLSEYFSLSRRTKGKSLIYSSSRGLDFKGRATLRRFQSKWSPRLLWCFCFELALTCQRKRQWSSLHFSKASLCISRVSQPTRKFPIGTKWNEAVLNQKVENYWIGLVVQLGIGPNEQNVLDAIRFILVKVPLDSLQDSP